MGCVDFLQDIKEVQEDIFRYNENLEKVDDIQKKFLGCIGWDREERKNLLNNLNIVIKNNKSIEHTVKN